jgi:hypothetical protein
LKLKKLTVEERMTLIETFVAGEKKIRPKKFQNKRCLKITISWFCSKQREGGVGEI